MHLVPHTVRRVLRLKPGGRGPGPGPRGGCAHRMRFLALTRDVADIRGHPPDIILKLQRNEREVLDRDAGRLLQHTLARAVAGGGGERDQDRRRTDRGAG